MSEYEAAVVHALQEQAKSAQAQEEHLAKIREHSFKTRTYLEFFYWIWWLGVALGVLVLVVSASSS